jgi:hypothetical protein
MRRSKGGGRRRGRIIIRKRQMVKAMAKDLMREQGTDDRII